MQRRARKRHVIGGDPTDLDPWGAERVGRATLHDVEEGRRSAVRVVAPVVAVVVIALLVVGQWTVRRALDEGIVCEVTEASVAADSARPEGMRSYTGGDHPAGPEVGDLYTCSSGGIAGEKVCHRSVGIVGTRLVDCTTI